MFSRYNLSLLNTFAGPTVGTFCIDLAIKKAKEAGIGWVSARGNFNQNLILLWFSPLLKSSGITHISLHLCRPHFRPLSVFALKYVDVSLNIWAASSEFGTYRLCEQRRFRRACASAQSRQNLHCSLIQAVSQEEPSDRKPDPWPLWMAGHAQLQFVMTECSKTQIRVTWLILLLMVVTWNQRYFLE